MENYWSKHKYLGRFFFRIGNYTGERFYFYTFGKKPFRGFAFGIIGLEFSMDWR